VRRKTDVNKQEAQEMLQSFKGISEYIAEVSSRMAERMQPLIEELNGIGKSAALEQIAEIQRKQQELDRQVSEIKINASEQEMADTLKSPRKYTLQHGFRTDEPQSNFYAETPTDENETSVDERWTQKYGPSSNRLQKPPRKMAMPRLRVG
jgi:DNA-directed RNA polymerase subunit F